MKAPNIFLSWSGERSRLVANALKEWLPLVLGEHADPWFSETDIAAGSRSIPELGHQLERRDCGILCLTRENKTSPWIMFEAGALSKSLDKSAVIPYLIDLQITDLVGPLRHFQAKTATKEGTFDLVSTVNQRIGLQVSSSLLRERFDLLWPKLDKHIQTARSETNAFEGWWIYSLLAETPDGMRDTIGYFDIQHREDRYIISEGRAFWVIKDSLIHRGNWRSDLVWLRSDMIKFIYTMASVKAIENSPSEFDGYLELRTSQLKPVLGRSCWLGSFNDLKDRSLIKGPVYAEHLGEMHSDPSDLRDRLQRKRKKLLEIVHDFGPGRIAAALAQTLEKKRMARSGR
ncbi:MAG TPA: TIR domain-containing protein [Candidatus Angelobacter sp.]|nr:TIR domain-containing protein [Candidatus Angelobacter sp.]